MDNLLPVNSVTTKSNEQAVKPAKAATTSNIVARVLGWHQTAGAKVELLTAAGGHPLGAQFTVEVADRRRGTQIDFKFRKGLGLRVGGVVILRSSSFLSPTEIRCLSVETIMLTPKEGPIVVNHDAAAYIYPSTKKNSMVPTEVEIALLKDAVRLDDLDETLARLPDIIETASMFGSPSLLLTGRDEDGDFSELLIRLDKGRLSPQEIAAQVADDLDTGTADLIRECAKQARKARKADRAAMSWYLVPLCRAELEPDTDGQSKAAGLLRTAQLQQIDYGTPGEMYWTKTNAIMKSAHSVWFVSDVSPAQEPSDVLPKLIIEILVDLQV
jgi:hypothetical protein